MKQNNDNTINKIKDNCLLCDCVDITTMFFGDDCLCDCH